MRSLLMVAVGMLALTNARAQKQLSYHFKDKPLAVFLKELGSADPAYSLFFQAQEMAWTRVDCDVTQKTIPEILQLLFDDLPFYDSISPWVNRQGFYIHILRDGAARSSGVVTDSLGIPQPGLTVSVKGSDIATTTGPDGLFLFRKLPDSAVLEITGANILNRRIAVRGHDKFRVVVEFRTNELPGANISRVATGIIKIPRIGLPVSLTLVDSEKLRDIVSPNILDHFDRYSSGLQASPESNGSPGLTIRGWSTLYSQHEPLMVRDYFVYPGLPSDFNPYDIQSVTILKDVGAANIYGTRSANGVIVYTSPEGEYRQPPHWILTLNTSFISKPNLSYMRWMKPGDFIDFETTAFNSGFYTPYMDDPTFPVTPGLQILRQIKEGAVDNAAGQQQLEQMKTHSLQKDLSDYFYQTSLITQAHLQLAGGTVDSQKYAISLAYDYSPTSYVRNKYQRFSLHANYTAHPLTPKLETQLLFSLASIETRLNNTGAIPVGYTYARLTTPDGKPAATAHFYNPGYIDTAGQGALYDWSYRPLQELRLANQQTNRYVGDIQAGLTWRPIKGFSAAGFFQLFKGWSFNRTIDDPQSFYVRDKVNQFAQINGANVSWPVPYGGILFRSDTFYNAWNCRLQLGYERIREKRSNLNIYAGFEVSDNSANGVNDQIYDYEHANPAPMDYSVFYSTRPSGQQQIPNVNTILQRDERYVSWFANCFYIRHRYSLYASGRLDASNFMGVEDPRKWAPFWATGATLQLLGNHRKYAPTLQWKAAIGCNGNISDRVSWLTVQTLGNNIYGNPQLGISNMPDLSPQWEKVYLLNTGFEFSLLRDKLDSMGRLFGSIDYYRKKAVDLLGYDSLVLSAGYPEILSPSAGIRGQGIDLQLNWVAVRTRVRWQMSLLLSYADDKVSRYGFKPLSPTSYVTGNFPKIGNAPDGIYAYRNARLDSANGAPRGYLHGQLSTDYNALLTDSGAGIIYKGSALPKWYGSWWNSIGVGNWLVELGIGFKAGYYIRRPSIDWGSLLLEGSNGDIDYTRRWTKPGDELHTDVPSMPTTLNTSRDAFYHYGQNLIVSGAYIRLQDLRVAYTLRPHAKKPAFKKAILYTTVSNLLILWRANHEGIDPDAVAGLPAPRTWSIGCKVLF